MTIMIIVSSVFVTFGIIGFLLGRSERKEVDKLLDASAELRRQTWWQNFSDEWFRIGISATHTILANEYLALERDYAGLYLLYTGLLQQKNVMPIKSTTKQGAN